MQTTTTEIFPNMSHKEEIPYLYMVQGFKLCITFTDAYKALGSVELEYICDTCTAPMRFLGCAHCNQGGKCVISYMNLSRPQGGKLLDALLVCSNKNCRTPTYGHLCPYCFKMNKFCGASVLHQVACENLHPREYNNLISKRMSELEKHMLAKRCDYSHIFGGKKAFEHMLSSSSSSSLPPPPKRVSKKRIHNRRYYRHGREFTHWSIGIANIISI